jgi:hypothetical protein
MFGDTITITRSGVDIVLNKTNAANYVTEYRLLTDLSLYQLTIRHTTRVDKASGVVYDRHNAEFVQDVYAAGAVPQMKYLQYFVWEVPRGGSLTGAEANAQAFVDWLDMSSPDTLAKLKALES